VALRRLALAESGATGAAAEDAQAIALLGENNWLVVETLPTSSLDSSRPIALPAKDQPRRQAALGGLDERLLLVTSLYRFFLATPRHLAESAAIGVAPADLFHLKSQESITALGRWEEVKRRPRLFLLTSKGYARAYPTQPLITSIEGPTALKFDQPLPGVPLVVTGAGPDDHLLVGLDNGRLVRLALAAMPLHGLQAINRRPEETIVAALLAPDDEAALLLTVGGFARRLPLAAVELAAKANTRGRVMLSRRPLAAILPGNKSGWALTTSRLLPVDPCHLPLDEDSLATRPLLDLDPGEEILTSLNRA
jgi:DNA gyrase/topoisomerase IV subunit A